MKIKIRTHKEREADKLVFGEKVLMLSDGFVYDAEVVVVSGDDTYTGYKVVTTGRYSTGWAQYQSRSRLFRNTPQEIREAHDELNSLQERARNGMEDLRDRLEALTPNDPLDDGTREDCYDCGEAWQREESDANDPDRFCCRSCEEHTAMAEHSRG